MKQDVRNAGFSYFLLHTSYRDSFFIRKKMNKYERLKTDLDVAGTGKLKAFGNSMLPILKNGSQLTFVKAPDYNIGDIVFCKVKGRYIDAHKVVKKDANKGFLIANNHGFENGWTKIIYGKVIVAEYQGRIIYKTD
jgi:SOS-response transcriptional repressor LexA